MEIEVKGHSGCSVEIVREGNNLYIDKSTKDANYVERLLCQAEKQKKASEKEYQFVRVPRVFHIQKKDDFMIMRMEYIYSKNFIDHFESAGFEQVSYFIQAFKLFIEKEINSSSQGIVDRCIVLEKFADVKRKIIASQFFVNDSEIEEILLLSERIFLSLPNRLEFPLGVCHGDMTFSNILFNGNNYYLIDFLDSFIESPLMDMVKLRQDTVYKWSTLMYTSSFDQVRLNIILSKIDDEMNLFFSRYDWYNTYYSCFQLMNFLRILQYAHEDRIIGYLKGVLRKLLNKDEEF